MNIRRVINYFRHTSSGLLLLFLGLFFLALFFVHGFHFFNRRAVAAEKPSLDERRKPAPLLSTVQQEMVPFKVPAAQPTPALEPQVKMQAKALPISLYTSVDEEEPISDQYAPFGRLLQCELVNTVDSSNIDTPIIGLLLKDIYNQGRLIIPAGTEVHGKAQVDRSRERIASQNSWTLVWQTGEELNVTGIALDMERQPDDSTWGITDGSAGLRGEILKTDDLAEIKLFLSTFISAGASALQNTQTNAFGIVTPQATAKNAALAGSSAILNQYAAQVLDTIRREGFFVRVPAGKQFYLYVTQTIDKSQAKIGGTRLSDSKNITK